MDSLICPVEEEPAPTILKLGPHALTHSYNNNNNNNGKSFTSYRRLVVLGDTVIRLTVSKHLYSTYPSLDPERLSSLLAANTSNEKLARVVVRRGLHCVTSLVDKV
ncbi:ribonuclease 3-like protein 2 [Quercus suber]|uniref:Ribonuclease 3-like protein 2 n=1 Tax=Quercus suber TaxID=58331 RepID=A0AAW0KL88_QUESU